jgi:3-hydroxybutyryl-CoA dehydrogenase
VATATSWLGGTEASRLEENIECVRHSEAALAESALVIEAIVEDLAAKQRLFVELDRLAPADALLCSNTSALPIREITADLERTDRVVGTHWFNPPHLVPAIEIVPAPGTSAHTISRITEILASLGKEPVVVPDIPGFVANRLQMALVREAMICVEDGLMSAPDIDRLFVNSIGFRLAAVGPLQVADHAGLEIYEKVFQTLGADAGERFRPPTILTNLVGDGALGVKTGAGFLSYDDAEPDPVALRDERLRLLATLTSSTAWAPPSRPMGERRALRLAEGDTVAVVLVDTAAGDTVSHDPGATTVALDAVPRGHKVAVADIAIGAKVLKYGEPIGIATETIKRGQHVHTHNLSSARAQPRA